MMKDSKIDQAWLASVMRSNPPAKLADNKGYISGPVRLSFVNIFEKGKSQPRDDGSIGEGKYGCTLLFPPGTNLEALGRAWTDAAMATFPEKWDASQNVFHGLEPPWHDQAKKAFGDKPLAGYTSGAMYMNISSKYKPSVVDAGMNPVVDPARVYAGVWAMVVMNVYPYGKSPPRPKRGIGFGLQTLMLIGDDTKLAGGGVDPKQVFAGIKIDSSLNVAAQFGGAMPTGGFTGTPGTLPVQGLPPAQNLADLGLD